MLRTFLLALALASPVAAFFGKAKGPAPIAARSPLTEAAIGKYRSKFSSKSVELPRIFKSPMYQEGSLASKLDGPVNKPTTPKKPRSELTDVELSRAFNVISSLYGGEENALEMVGQICSRHSYLRVIITANLAPSPGQRGSRCAWFQS